MASVDFPLTADEGMDDLPRTLRREREARQRAAREKEDKARAATLTHDFGMSDERSSKSYPVEAATGAVVTRFDVPFTHLMAFSIKAVLAAIPAMILLGVLLWFAGVLLKAYYPELVHMQILINFPKAT